MRIGQYVQPLLLLTLNKKGLKPEMEVKLHVTGETTTGTDIVAKVFQAKGRDFKDVSLDDPLIDAIREWIYQPYDPDEDATADIPIKNIRELVAYIKVFEGNIKSLSIEDKDAGFDYWASISDEIRSQPEIHTEVVSADLQSKIDKAREALG
jgi:hypothetical protein